MALIRPTTYAEFIHPISTYIAPLCGFAGKRAFVGGTAVIVAPGLAIAASHVLDEIRAQFGFDRSSKNIELDIYVNQLNTGACWYVCHASSWVGTDITVLSLKPRNDNARSASVGRLPVTVDPPTVGTNVTALGYPGTGLTIPQNDRDVLKMNFSITPTVSEGEVVEVHRSFRDSANLRFPCFAVNAGFTAGMSGGAVFNASKELCGLVCSGGEGEFKNYSHSVSSWPLAIIPVTLADDIPSYAGVTAGMQYRMLDLARVGYIRLNGHERIEFFKHENGSDGVRRHQPQGGHGEE
jgi:hypothetical protein